MTTDDLQKRIVFLDAQMINLKEEYLKLEGQLTETAHWLAKLTVKDFTEKNGNDTLR